mgnify:CR=1 FL=1
MARKIYGNREQTRNATLSTREYEVSKIVSWDKKKKRVRVRWRGFGAKDDTFEPLDDIGRLPLWKEFVKVHKVKI